MPRTARTKIAAVNKATEPEYIFSGDNSLSSIGEKIFLDRYALKDGTKKSLKVGDTVVVCTDTKTGRREIGLVAQHLGENITVELRDGTIIERLLEHIDVPVETKPVEMMARVARGIASVEATPEGQTTWENNFRWLLDGYKFVPAGRILTTAGSSQKLTCYNCYVIPSPHDSRGGILQTLSQMNEIFSRGGGVGINLSSLRPRYAYVKGVNGRSSGAVSWGSLYSFSTGLIEQGGSRRGALMLILNVWHPDIFEFINSKREAGKITNANISIGVTDDFMAAVKADKDWDLVFPDMDDPQYNELWDGNLDAWRAKGKATKVYKTVRAKELWDTLIESAWASAEPGLYFIERSNKMSNSWYFAPLTCTNPCGEQPLPAWGVCNLGAINLSKFIDEAAHDVAWEKLRQAVSYAVRFLDNVIDWTPYFFEENENQQKGERRVGLNTMGLAEMMIQLGIRYGSEDSSAFIDRLYRFISGVAYQTSAELAEEKGAFPQFEADKFLESGYMQAMPKEIRQLVREKGVRNVTLLTQAPNGTIGTMVGTSTGIEPFYSWTYFRTSRLGTHEEKIKLVEDWQKQNVGKTLPDYFVTAMDLAPSEHVQVQADIQRWVDSAISKTCNTPESYTIEQTRELYEKMYDLGCKGGTIYRDKSRDVQVLNLEKVDENKAVNNDSNVSVPCDGKTSKGPTLGSAASGQGEPPAAVMLGPALSDSQSVRSIQEAQEEFRIKPRPRPAVIAGTTEEINTGMGKMFVTINEDGHGPFEVFASIGKSGNETTSLTEAIGRLISVSLRSGIEVKTIIKHLKGIRGSSPVWQNGELILSVPDAIAKTLERYIDRKNSLGLATSSGSPLTAQTSTAEAADSVASNEAPIAAAEVSATESLFAPDAAVVAAPSNPILMTAPVGKKHTSSFVAGDLGLCPMCSSANYVLQSGCPTCSDCGYSKCG